MQYKSFLTEREARAFIEGLEYINDSAVEVDRLILCYVRGSFTRQFIVAFEDEDEVDMEFPPELEIIDYLPLLEEKGNFIDRPRGSLF